MTGQAATHAFQPHWQSEETAGSGDQDALDSKSITKRAIAASVSMSYLDALNPEQIKAVEALQGSVLVLAGAGTGKTRVLTTRIAHILATASARPNEILAVTFTNKAAREMKTRIGMLLGNTVEGMPWLGTFHSIGARMLRFHAELAGLNSKFTILDIDDQIRLLKQILRAENIDEKRWPARQLAHVIDRWKNRGLLPETVSDSNSNNFADGRSLRLYKLYQERLKDLNAVDFGDLILQPTRILQTNPDILAGYRRRFKFLLVDEYQDTNVAQYLWLRLLAGSSANLCCVGDDDQSIYGWRGAQVDNILRFETDFPGATIVRLERNYRSTPAILATASHLISHNSDRLGKTLFSGQDSDPDTPKVMVGCAYNGEEEARDIGDEIEALQSKDHPLDEVAILVRASYQMREFEDRFLTLGLNYRVIGGPRFYERLEIRDALAYLRVASQPHDDLALERIINTPRRGIGDATLQILHTHARMAQKSLFASALELCKTQELKPRQRSVLEALLRTIERWHEASGNLSHTELAEMILDESGYTAMWQNERSPDAPGRLENLKELVRSMEEYDSLAAFLEHIALVMEREGNTEAKGVYLMTLHSAKGLEFDTVFLPGWEEGLFPHQRALDEGGNRALEEERRLAYVGLTRARKNAYIWFAMNRRVRGLWQSSPASRFLDELPREHVQIRERTAQNFYGNQGFHGNESYSPRRARRMDGALENSPHTPTIKGEVVERRVEKHEPRYAVSDKVRHLKFGLGRVVAVEGNRLTIEFETAGQKKVMDSFLKPA